MAKESWIRSIWTSQQAYYCVQLSNIKTYGGSLVAVDKIAAADALCHKIHEEFHVSEELVYSVHSKTPQDVRERVLTKFLEGGSTTIISPDAWTKGLHHPEFAHVVIYRFPGSQISTSQTFTRLLGAAVVFTPIRNWQ